ncbi:MAG: thermonuclease family protein [candidate division NC10 bacterium]|nr:thermonuclease family protein [candidate division NC10 bacterium]
MHLLQRPLLIVSTLALIGNLWASFSLLAQETALETYCDRVADGWTLHSPDFGEIRLLGIEPLAGPERTQLEEKIRKDLSSRVEGRKIALEFEGSAEDSSGRLLAYVSDGEAFLNAWMLKNGYARLSQSLRPLKHQQLFQQLQREAQENRRGVWGLSMASPAGTTPPKAKEKPKIIASKKSRYYYRPGQYYYDKVEPRHRVDFESEEEARKAGFRPYPKK